MCRFTIRDMLWLTALLGLGLAWFIDHCHQATIIRIEQGYEWMARDLHDACIRAGWTVEIHHGAVFLAHPPGQPPPMSAPLPLPTPSHNQ